MTHGTSLPPPVDAEPQDLSGLGALRSPLPAGLRDLLPGEASRQSMLMAQLLESFDLHGYLEVELPAFEYAAVLERGLGALEPSEVLRFVEPGTGEVVVLRPDMTPQVARLVAMRLYDAPSPIRLAYRGSVLRRRRQRARRHREIPQVGLELIGLPGLEGDLEVLSTACAGLRATGLGRFTIDLGNVKIASSLLAQVDRELWPELLEPLHLKDSSSLARVALELKMPAKEAHALASLVELHGGLEVFARAEKLLGDTPAAPALWELKQLATAAEKQGLAELVLVDLGETWDFNYYTGTVFHLLAEGPGAPIGSGGRYDGLLGRFGSPNAAAGFAVDVTNLGWALARLGQPPAAVRLLVTSESKGPESEAMARATEKAVAALRGGGIRVATAKAEEVPGLMKAFPFSHALWLEAGRATLRSKAATEATFAFDTPELLVAKVRESLKTGD